MSIFSLKTDKHFVRWSLGLGVLLFCIDSLLYSIAVFDHCLSSSDMEACTSHYERMFLVFFQNPYLNLLFWIIVSWIILSLVRHFKRKPA